MATLTISLKKITAEVKFAGRKSALLQNNNVKQILPFVQSYKVTPPLHHPKNNNFISKRRLIHPLQREIYKKPRLSPRFSSAAKIFGHLSHSIELVRMCLACQHFDLNSADWISDNLHLISRWYLRTMGKEFIFRFSRRSFLRTSAWEATGRRPS